MTANRVDVVFDVYVESSIKDVERSCRSHGELELKKIIGTAEIKQWTLRLSTKENKNKLIRFIVQQWKNNCKLEGNKVFM